MRVGRAGGAGRLEADATTLKLTTMLLFADWQLSEVTRPADEDGSFRERLLRVKALSLAGETQMKQVVV